MKVYARRTDPQTSHDAAKTVDVTKLEGIVLTTIKNRGDNGATGKEIAQITQTPLNSITPRTAPLRRKGLIKDSGKRRGRSIVWVVGCEQETVSGNSLLPLPKCVTYMLCNENQEWVDDVVSFLKTVTSHTDERDCMCKSRDGNYTCWTCRAKQLLQRTK